MRKSGLVESEALNEKIKQMVNAAGDGAYLSSSSSPRAHRIVMKVAREFCGEMYEIYAKKWPDFYAAFPSENAFVRKFWPHFCGAARATLAQMLGGNYDEKLKREIHDGLIKDASLIASRSHVPQIDLTK